MSGEIRVRRWGRLPILAFAALGALVIPLSAADAQIYPGWDFGGGIGIGIGPPPSAYNPCPTYGWPVYPYPCAYRYYGRPHHSSHYRRSHHYARAAKPPAPSATPAPAETNTAPSGSSTTR